MGLESLLQGQLEQDMKFYAILGGHMYALFCITGLVKQDLEPQKLEKVSRMNKSIEPW